MSEKKKVETTPATQASAQEDLVTLHCPQTNKVVHVPRPQKGARKDGEKFNQTVMDPESRNTWSQTFQVRGGIVNPVDDE